MVLSYIYEGALHFNWYLSTVCLGVHLTFCYICQTDNLPLSVDSLHSQTFYITYITKLNKCRCQVLQLDLSVECFVLIWNVQTAAFCFLLSLTNLFSYFILDSVRLS